MDVLKWKKEKIDVSNTEFILQFNFGWIYISISFL